MESLNGIQLVVGMKVWVDTAHMGANYFPGDCMYGEVVQGHRQAQNGQVWVRQIATAACPVAGDAWIGEHFANRCLAV
ncbi:MAG: hypothetical protein CMF19_07500 [Idiomarinaceae bacterium]|nr:hypothetical protein [Idiomarinaceae bacterium]